MNLKHGNVLLTLSAVVWGLLGAGSASAQGGGDTPRPAASVEVSDRPEIISGERSTFNTNYDGEFDLEPVAESAADTSGQQCGNACDCGQGSCRRCWCCPSELQCCEENPWQLFQCFNDGNCAGIQVYGWVNGGFTDNDDDNPSDYNGVTTFNDREEGMLNQFYVVTEKTLDNCGCGWGLGGRVDMLYGTDSRFTEARGLENTRDGGVRWNDDPHYGLAMPQAYLEVGYNDLSVKLGHFYTIIGYESVMAPSNFFYSHAYTMQYGEPFTHTGMLATYRYNDNWTFAGGFDRGWDNWEDDDNDQLSYLGGATWTNGDDLTIALSGTAGTEPVFGQDGSDTINSNRYLSSFVLSKKFNSRLTYVFQNDIGFQEGAAGVMGPGGDNAEWYGINQYLFYKLNCCWTAGARFEWFRDDDGVRVAPYGTRIPGVLENPASDNSHIGNFYAVTTGLNWSPNANLIVRPELRFDWFDPEAGSDLPFGDDTSRDQVTASVDAIIKY